MGRSNMGGAHAINPKFPAALERQLAAEARAWGEKAAEWRRTAAMLNSMAEHWDYLASFLEERGRQDAMRDQAGESLFMILAGNACLFLSNPLIRCPKLWANLGWLERRSGK
ncbi:MAG: hypothetical protein ABSG41_04555 [Bryobacteraceae bacterium]